MNKNYKRYIAALGFVNRLCFETCKTWNGHRYHLLRPTNYWTEPQHRPVGWQRVWTLMTLLKVPSTARIRYWWRKMHCLLLTSFQSLLMSPKWGWFSYPWYTGGFAKRIVYRLIWFIHNDCKYNNFICEPILGFFFWWFLN